LAICGVAALARDCCLMHVTSQHAVRHLAISAYGVTSVCAPKDFMPPELSPAFRLPVEHVLRGLLVEMEGLRIKGGGEALDPLVVDAPRP
jgi:hypothetical protein